MTYLNHFFEKLILEATEAVKMSLLFASAHCTLPLPLAMHLNLSAKDKRALFFENAALLLFKFKVSY